VTASADDHALADAIADAAGQLLLGVRNQFRGDGRRLQAEGDRQAHDFIIGELGARRPNDGVLSEEGQLDPARLDRRRVWIVDPLDGTREFSEDDRTDWAVHVALVEDGFPIAGAVALPALRLTHSTAHPAVLAPLHDNTIRVLVSRTRPPDVATALAAALPAVLVPMGSAGAKAMAVVRGEAEVYAHSGGQFEWDSAAPVAVAAAAGLHVSRLDGTLLRYNSPNPWLPDLLICRRELVDQILAITAHRGSVS
jgi:3'(2'), 5'-bisphosphate nucleotidase